MPCTPLDTALLLVAERGPSDLGRLREVLMERFPSLTFLAATELLEDAIEVRDRAFDVADRVFRGRTTRESALSELSETCPEVPADALERFLDDGFLAASR